MDAAIAGDPAADVDLPVVFLLLLPTAGSVLMPSVVLALPLTFTTAPVVRMDLTALASAKYLVDGRRTVVALTVLFFTAMPTILSYRRLLIKYDREIESQNR
jgi:hypothetical protein